MHWFFYHSYSNPQLYKASLINCDLAKLELFGDEYIEECIKQYIQGKKLKEYITDCLQIIVENTAKFAGGRVINTRYAELINPKPKDTRTAEQVIDDLNKRCGLTMIETEEGE